MNFSSDVLKSRRVSRYDAELQKVTHQFASKRGQETAELISPVVIDR